MTSKNGDSSLASRPRSGINFSPWPRQWLMLAVIAIALVGGAALTGANGQRAPELRAEILSHDFGEVSISGGLLNTSLPLDVEGEVLVTSLTST